jgi:trimethylamine---corrinoid protein Co-methyltransferase
MTFRTNYTVNKTTRFRLLSEDQKARIFRGVIKTLNDTGANVHHEEVREILGKNRCKVDGKRVRIPPEVVLDALASLPPTTTLYSWDNDEEMCYVEPGRSYFGPGPTPPNFNDPDTLERRPYLRKDATTVARVCDALPNIGYVQSLGSISDVTNGLADVYEFADMIQNTRKIIMNWAFSVENLADEHRIGIVMAGGRKPSAGARISSITASRYRR